MQNGEIVCYASRALADNERRWAQIEKELLAIQFAAQRFHHYVYGAQIRVQTDHKPLISIMSKNMSEISNNRLKRLKKKLYLYNIEYIPGSKF